MKVVAKITSKFGGTKAAYKEILVPQVESYSIDSALDTDSDSWSIDIGDPDAALTELLLRDNEVRVTLVAGDSDNPPTILQTGFADLVAFSQNNLLSLQGRDVTAVAVDSTAPAQNYTSARAHTIIKNQGSELGIPAFSLAQVKAFGTIFTDGSESYWAFWYRMYRKREMWLWAEPDGMLVADKLHYSEVPVYFFGRPDGKTPADHWMPVESADVRKSTQTRIGEVWVLGATGSNSFDAKFKDKDIQDWMKKPFKIIQEVAVSGATGKKVALKEAKEEIFESKVGAVEITITIADPGQIIRQNNMAQLNIPSMGYSGMFFVVGTTMTGGADGFRQQVRLREKDFAISARVPVDPSKTTTPTTSTPNAANIALGGRKDLFSIFQLAAKEFHSPWDYSLFLGVLLSICEKETGFRNVRNPPGGPEWYSPPKKGTLHYDQNIGNWHGYFANSINNPVAPRYGRSETAVGYMQLLTLSYKQFADNRGGKITSEETNEYAGGRWTPEGNIFGGAMALQSKGAGFSGKNSEDIWKAVASYGEGASYADDVKRRYETTWRAKVDVAEAAVLPSADNSVVTQGSKKVLANQILHRADIAFTNACQRSDIANGVVSIKVMQCILAFADAGFTTIIKALKCDHNQYTKNEHNISAHFLGQAVDFGGWNEGNSFKATMWWNSMVKKLGIDQIICPIDSLTYPRNYYSSATLADHDDHIHIGF